jgi:hypothetical protein
VGYINGGFMVREKGFVTRYLKADKGCFRAGADAQASGRADVGFRPRGFWQCLDTPREYQSSRPVEKRRGA